MGDIQKNGSSGFDWAALGTLGALVASITYVLLNSAYVEFYESLGVRPEDVGFDRLAILARALGPVLVALVIYGAFFLAFIPLLEHAPFLKRHFECASAERIPWHRNKVRVAAIIACLLTFTVILSAIITISSRKAESVEDGTIVAPFRLGSLVLADVSADAARFQWLDKDVPPPRLLYDPWLLYLGSNNRVTVFMACGTTVIVPAAKVVPEILTTKNARCRANAQLKDGEKCGDDKARRSLNEENRRTFCATQ